MCRVPGCDREPKPPRKICETCRGRQRRHGDPTILLVKHGPETLVERFWDKVERRGPNECWPWTAATNKITPNYDQAIFAVGRKPKRAARVGWWIVNGKWPPAHLCVCHTCDNGLCMNPAHWWLGTHAQNQADMAAKGRSNNGRMNK